MMDTIILSVKDKFNVRRQTMYNKFVKIVKKIHKAIRALNKSEKKISKSWIDVIP